MVIPTFQMRAPSKGWFQLTSVLVILLAALAWGFSRMSPRAGDSEGAPASANEKAKGKRQKAESKITQAAVEDVSLVEPGSAEPKLVDSDNDGIPDAAELRSFQDRDSFRRWFTAIAELQFYQLSDQWNAEQRDCAGLARFAIREALRRHDRVWFQKMGRGYETVAADVSGFDLDHNPLGEKIFRTDFGSFQQTDLRDGRFSEFADGRALKNFNTAFVSRNVREAETGDLLFFYQPWVQKFPYHVMIFLGSPRVAPNGERDWVVYH